MLLCRIHAVLFVGLLMVSTANDRPVSAQEAPPSVIAREHHAWTRYAPGAWRSTQLTTETLDSNGQVTCRTVTSGFVSLEALKEDRYLLREESIVNAQGRHVNGAPEVIWRNIYVDDTQDAHVEESSQSKTIELNGQSVSCRLLRIRLTGRNQPRIAEILYNSDQPPYILKKELCIAEEERKEDLTWQSISEVVAVGMPYPFENQVFQTSHLRTVVTEAKGRTIRMAIVTDSVPGGIVTEWSKELDREGKVLRRGYLELVDYGTSLPSRRSWRRRSTGRWSR